jgi:hypothetical protein
VYISNDGAEVVGDDRIAFRSPRDVVEIREGINVEDVGVRRGEEEIGYETLQPHIRNEACTGNHPTHKN